MSSEGPNSPGSSSQSGGTGWSSVTTGVLASGGNSSSMNVGGSGETPFLYGNSFGFAIPSGATIDGILLEIRRVDLVFASSPRDKTVRLLKAGTKTGDNKAALSTNWPTSYAYATYGGSADLWSASWSPSDINDSGFGGGLTVTTPGGGASFAVDHIRITVYYTTSSPVGAALHHYRQQGMMRHQQPRLILPNRELITELPRRRLIENRLAT